MDSFDNSGSIIIIFQDIFYKHEFIELYCYNNFNLPACVYYLNICILLWIDSILFPEDCHFL